jgi:hypothetical protein
VAKKYAGRTFWPLNMEMRAYDRVKEAAAAAAVEKEEVEEVVVEEEEEEEVWNLDDTRDNLIIITVNQSKKWHTFETPLHKR